MSIEGEIAQTQFLNMGGTYARVLAKKQKDGELQRDYVFREYPKMLRIQRGVEDVEWSTETIKGTTVSGWYRDVPIYEDIVVNSEEEEERVMAGGQTSAQVEEERQALIMRCRSFGLKVDPQWSAVRLRRELGDKLDAPEPENRMAALENELATLQKMASMQAEIERLRAQMARPAGDEAEDLRQQLTALGVAVDGRWKLARLREELDAATAPAEAE
jgi:hypothetical protein